MAITKSVLIFVGDEYEDQELWYPKYRFLEAGYQVVLAGQEAGRLYKSKYGYPCKSDAACKDLKAADFAGVVCPGGWMPDKLRRDSEVLRLTREIAAAGKLTAAICHGGWIPISAGVYKGVKVTGSAGIKDDLINAGGEYSDQAVVVDRQFVSSRKPDDLPDFCRACLEILGQ